jgi:hypothetical protein
MSRAPTTAAQRVKRLHLLNATEIAALYDRPQFTDNVHKQLFLMPGLLEGEVVASMGAAVRQGCSTLFV